MIGALEGILQEKRPTRILINVSGVCYEVSIPLSTFYELPEEHSAVRLRIHTHVREDTFQLFGFSSTEERLIFTELIRVSGIGPKLAIAVLSGLSSQALAKALREGDLLALEAIPGVGKKTAQRMVIDLRDRLASVFDAEVGAIEGVIEGKEGGRGKIFDEAVSALENLGYSQKQAKKAVDEVLRSEEAEDLEIGTLLRRALRSLAR